MNERKQYISKTKQNRNIAFDQSSQFKVLKSIFTTFDLFSDAKNLQEKKKFSKNRSKIYIQNNFQTTFLIKIHLGDFFKFIIKKQFLR